LVRWQRPQRVRLKCHVDASFLDQLQITSIIVICICDQEGTFMLDKTISLSLPPMCSVSMGEALGLFHALQLLSEMQFDNVDFTLHSKIKTDTFHHH
jgi:hypothetical protein